MGRIQHYRPGITSAGYLTVRAMTRNLRHFSDSYVYPHLANKEKSSIILDVGCGHGPYRSFWGGNRVIGVNLDSLDASPDVVADGMRLPFVQNTFEVAVCTQVIEHVLDPDLLLKEIFKCLKSDGLLLLTGPMYWPLHEEPHDYWRFTKYGLKEVMRRNGFTLLELREDGHAIALAVLAFNQLFNGRIFFPIRGISNLLGLFAEWLIHIRHSTPNLSVVAKKTIF